ncbi:MULTISPECIES: ABC transporter permease [unclassified Microbacterium]|uniref:ABC transporter permease n=1 Tax=unclassified Microbacterium TaxID=2609290 RepID=UPI0004931AAC|nr:MULTISPECIES: ABC transporter permease [unclassified Microbacterium]MCV0333089.1 ABC transporter permease [Microbacterium sp.]MCV0375534.1 ABC transporter permease [Microbacterium sp.]MCV0389111.1 ABC transporter permease [Microbacterium sp.]MCV0417639.1 ABC transporter permease [Microbacterium sp.]MCV0420950.1 ABC transporter permease [Microbacterium sp.]
MLSYILRRLLQVIPVFFGATLLIYFLVFAMPGDPILALFGDRTPNPALVEALREQYHLNDPFIVQYWYYITGVLTGDLGTTFSGRSVADVLADTLPVTGRLAIMAIGIEFTLAIIVGTISGLRKGKAFDNIALVVALVAIAIPIFVLCFLAQYFLAIQWGWFKPTVGADNDWGGLWLPALVLGFSLFAVSMRLMRGSVIETLNQDWVRTAYSKGLSRGRVIPVHVLRNSLIPVITNSATNFGVLLVGATVTEGIFNVPGVGNTLFQAVQRGEGPTVVSFVTVFVILYVLVNLLVDLLYGLLDPRIRYV